MTSGQYVLDAVATDKFGSSQGLLQRLFAIWFDAFVYNQIWEDPRADLKALQLGADSRILTISSGGCNALNYLVENPESVTAVDLNRYHIHLLELKLAALKTLPSHEEFFRFFGFGKHADNRASYFEFIAPALNSDATKYWEGNSLLGHLTHGERINYFVNGGLYEHSRNGYFLRFFHRLAHAFGFRPEKLLEAQSLPEQAELFEKHIAPFFDSFIIRTLGKLPVTTFGLGIPPQQLEELQKDPLNDGSLIDIYRVRAKRLASAYPIADNYFAWQAFARKYDTVKRLAVPEYLKAEHFDALKSNVHRVRTVVGSITDQIRSNPSGTFNRFVFLDAQDWMNSALMTELWRQIADNGEPGSRIIFRTAAAASPLPQALPAELLDRFSYERELSQQLFAEDRASIYGGMHLYVLNR